MLPRWHILLGFLFSLLIYVIFPQISLISLSLVFLSSFLIDFDHYLIAVIKTKKLGLFNAFAYFKKLDREEQLKLKKGIKQRGPLMVFHTVEFHILVLLAAIFIHPLFYSILVGMLFHSIIDILSLKSRDILYHREFFLVKKF
ncbi:MAG: hypothetical protein WCK29_00215 [archaeon]